MAFFIESLNSQLYVAPAAGNDRGFAAFLLPSVPPTPAPGYDISEALANSDSVNGSFILSAYTPVLTTKEETDTFVNQLLGLLGTGRYIIWISDLSNFSATENTVIMTIAGDGSATIQGCQFLLVSGIALLIQNGMQLTATSDSIQLGSASGSAMIQFAGNNAPDPNVSNSLTGLLPFSGAYRGCISFPMFITRSSLADGFTWGFQMLIPLANNPVQTALSEFLPLASDSLPSPSDAIGFNITIDPTDIFNLAFDHTNDEEVDMVVQYNSRRSVFNFTGTNQDTTETLLYSTYFTTWGHTIQLVPSVSNTALPARLLLNNGEQFSANAQRSHLAPEGDFMIQVDGATATTIYPLQCGLQSTEFFNLQSWVNGKAGDSIRFIGNQPAYAPVFPLPQSSPVTAPVQPNTPLLNTEYRTSWCTVINAAGNSSPSYVAQPKGAALFGNNNSNGNGSPTSIIGHSTPNFTFTPDNKTLFPMLPYSAVVPDATGLGSFSLEQIENFENLFLSAIRKKNINSILIASQKLARMNFKKTNSLTESTPATVTTPSGLIAGLLGSQNNPVWKAIYLAQNIDSKGALTQMYFDNPDDELVQAFQTSDLFLVIGNNVNLGTDVNKGAQDADPAMFYNKMFIGDWAMQANTGTQNRYNDYNNIIIVKGRKGKLYDPADPKNSLVANWQKWTDKETFASPSVLVDQPKPLPPVPGPPDPSQLVILSQWMQTYFDNASRQTDTAYFGNFNAIAKDENWTGILILGMNISGLPTNLYGILSGVRDPAAFRAHHLGINITPVQQGANGPEINKTTPSSMFGLIYYNDPEFVPAQNPQPVTPDLSNTYDFIMLNLKVLFENTSVKSFQSYAQLTTNNFFGSPVDHMGGGGNTFNTMILRGALQFKGTEAIYSLGTDSVNTFFFNSPVVNKVEISSATFSTIGTNDSGDLVSLFSISGFWDFKKLTSTNSEGATTDFDIFSFGYVTNADEARKGLIFNNLGIQMVSPPYKPGQTDPLPKTMTFVTSAMTFDQGRSTPRPNSMYVNFALNLQNIVQGTTATTPANSDYLTVITDMKVSSISGTPWIGLSYQLNMGTPGKLAGNIGLTSYLLTAWNPIATDDGGSPPVLVGIKLPGTGGGAKLISLQSVLKLSIGQIRLAYAKDPNSEKYSFLLMLTDIAVKFLGLLKIPPNGATLFYLFGNPNADGKASGLGWYAMYKADEKEKSISRV
jgi:hypothetical protein